MWKGWKPARWKGSRGKGAADTSCRCGRVCGERRAGRPSPSRDASAKGSDFGIGPAERSGRGGGPGSDGHGESLTGADGGHLADGEAKVRWRGEGEAGEDERGDRADLELAETHADAGARAAAEGDVGAARKGGLSIWGKALGAEGVGLGEDVGQ